MALTEIDRNLLKRCIGREPGAWKDFVDRFVGLFTHVIHHVAHSRSIRVSQPDVDDLCAEVFVQLIADDFKILRRFQGNASLATYLTVIARRVVVRALSHRRFAEAMGHVNAHQASLERADASVGEQQQRIEDRDLVAQMLQGLGPREREVVKHFHLGGKSYREIGAALGVPENTIGPTLTRARAKLREQHAGS
ncbi:MAG: RNA polymerase sigma factor [Planctomycetaceae bacterium]